jgi:hypothetical protein
MIGLHREVLLRKLWGQYKSSVNDLDRAQPFQDGRGPELTASAVTGQQRRATYWISTVLTARS